MDKEKLQELIAALTAERDETVLQANARITYLNGKIDMLKELAKKEEEAPEANERAT